MQLVLRLVDLRPLFFGFFGIQIRERREDLILDRSPKSQDFVHSQARENYCRCGNKNIISRSSCGWACQHVTYKKTDAGVRETCTKAIPVPFR
jgi:hypothetical protein